MVKTMKGQTLCVVMVVYYFLPNTVYAQCVGDIIGKWQQTQVEFEGNKINDDSQSWQFMENGTVRFLKTTPEIDVSSDYECEGDIIHLKGKLPGRLKILEHDGEMMAWESLDHGPGITHVKRVK